MEEKKLEVMESINDEIQEAEEIIESNEKSGMNTGLAMAIGGALTLATVAGVKKLRALWKERKEKKEDSFEEVDIVSDDFYDDEQEFVEK